LADEEIRQPCASWETADVSRADVLFH
jgi:hypothetical protein